MQFDWMSSIIGFLFGAATGAAGAYFAEKYTDRRRTQESARQAKKEFLEVRKQMSELIAKFKNDLYNVKHKLIREFFVLPNNRVSLGGSTKPRFVYYSDEHEDLRSKLTILENKGYLIDVTLKNTPIFRMTEEFVGLVQEYG